MTYNLLLTEQKGSGSTSTQKESVDLNKQSNKFVFCDANNIVPKIDPKTNKSKTNDSKNNDPNIDCNCAPGKKYDETSCFSLEDLVDIVKAYNKHYKLNGSDKHIELSWEKSNDKRKYKKHLVDELTKALEDICSDQMCWLKQKFMTKLDKKRFDDITKNTFRPKTPQGKFKWLNTINLDDVMKQYEEMYKDFKYLGTVPMDFDHIEKKYNLSNINYKKMIDEGITKYGSVINFDNHDEDGSHWVGIFVNFSTGEISYFDSYGDEVPPKINDYMNNMVALYKKLCKKDAVKKVNDQRHQYKNSECGVYSINFILKSLSGKDMDDIFNNIVDDDNINLCRSVYFSGASRFV